MFREAAARVAAARPDLQIIVAGTSGAEYPDPGAIRCIRGSPARICRRRRGDLQVGHHDARGGDRDVPMVITYRVHPISSFIASACSACQISRGGRAYQVAAVW